MSDTNNGGPAFPRPAGDFNGTRHGNAAQTGMTLHDYFAAHAPAPVQAMDLGEHCAYRFRYADAMLAARAMPKPAEPVREAAPEMLEVLREADEDFAREGFGPESPYRVPIRAAIAKATGQEGGAA